MADNDTRLSFENAKWAVEQLKNLTPANQASLLNAFREQNFGEFEKILFENGMLNSVGIWQGLIDRGKVASEGVNLAIEAGKEEKTPPGNTGGALGAFGAAAALATTSKSYSYEDFKKQTESYANESVEYWEKEEEKYINDPLKTREPSRAKTKHEARDQAEKYIHDRYLYSNHEEAKEWAKNHPNDTPLAQALARKELQRKNLSYQEFAGIRKQYLKNAADEWNKKDPSTRYNLVYEHIEQANREFNDRLLIDSPDKAREWATNDPHLADAAERKRLAEEEAINKSRIKKRYYNSRLGKKAMAANQRIKNSRVANAYSKFNHGIDKLIDIPGAIKNRIFRRLAVTRIGKVFSRINHAFGAPGRLTGRIKTKIAGSRLGKLGSKAGRLTKKISNLLNPIAYLQKLLVRSIAGAAISAIGGASSTLLGMAAGAITSSAIVLGSAGIAVGSAAGISITAAAAAFGKAIAVIIVIVLPGILLIGLISILAAFFQPETPGGEPNLSPYPGIFYSIVAQEEVSNGTDIEYSIIFSHDNQTAEIPLETITLYSLIPAGTSFVSATGNYDISTPGTIKWKLYPENSSTRIDEGIINGIASFSFTLIVRPQDDVVVENTLSIEGAQGTGPIDGGGNIPPNEDLCQGNKYDYIAFNKLLPKNFGDPECTLDTFAKRDNLYALLKQKDPKWADFWFDVVIPGESGYRPNAWGCGHNGSAWDPATGKCREPWAARGAWGLFQMGSSNPPGGSGNRIDGRGDVTWPEQVDNAIDRNKSNERIDLLFCYWAVAKNYCKAGHMGQEQCRDVGNPGCE